MKIYIIPGLICCTMATAITIHSVLVLPRCLQQHFLVRNLLTNAIGVIALLMVALLARRSRVHLIVLWTIFGSAIAWLFLTTFHWPLAAYFAPLTAAWLANGCAVAAIVNRHRASSLVVGVCCLTATLYAVKHTMLERERPSATCNISAGQTN